jgi:hypothetical protein
MTERAFLRDIKSPELIVDCLERALSVWQLRLSAAVDELQVAFAQGGDTETDEHVMDAALKVNAVILDMQRAERDLQQRRAFKHV